MKVTVENKKGLEKNIKILIDKKTISEELDSKYQEIKKDVVLKGFRPGKVPTEILKRQFGKAVYGEVIDKVLKETSAKALEDNKIKFIGPSSKLIKMMGDKIQAKKIAKENGLPVIEGSEGGVKDITDAKKLCKKIVIIDESLKNIEPQNES